MIVTMKKKLRSISIFSAIAAVIFVMSVSVSAEPKASTPYTVKVDSGYLALRSKPEYNSSNELRQLYTGDVFYMVSEYDSTYWYGYSEDQTAGYVNKNYLVEDTPCVTGICAGAKIRTSEDASILETDYFELSLPKDIPWEYQVIDDNAMRFIYTPAKEADYGGQFLSIRAFPWSDNSYADFPSWKIAGLSSDKKYVAIFPTDLQFDPNDSTQVQEYHLLSDTVNLIDQNSETGDNPFRVK